MKRTEYPCLVPGCTELACFFAIDNRAKYGHVGFNCYRQFKWNGIDDPSLYAPRPDAPEGSSS